MKNQLYVNVRWAEATKRWMVEVGAVTTSGVRRHWMHAEDPYGSPMTDAVALQVLDYVVMALEQRYPF